jgi:hypothetical protein
VHADIDVKEWAKAVPAIGRVRPRRCPCCEAPARPVGARLGLVGHGLRERQVRGPLDASGVGGFVVVRVRRFRCRTCGAVITVVPRGVVRGRHFGAGTIGLAIALVSTGLPTRAVRERAGGFGAAEATEWRTVRAWVEAGLSGRLLRSLRGLPGLGRAAGARRLASLLVGHAPPGATTSCFPTLAFLGAVEAARAA